MRHDRPLLRHATTLAATSALLALPACGGDTHPAEDDAAIVRRDAYVEPGADADLDAAIDPTLDAATVVTGDDAAVVADDAPVALPPFSFFVTSLAALQALSGSPQGFGGDLSYGETGAGAGLRGADRLCAEIAERSMPGASAKGWRAYLSATDDGSGHQVDARDRIGTGPWYDRNGRLLAPTLDDLFCGDRPCNGDTSIRDDFPNEDGVPNHQPDPTQPEVDNHDMLTGSTAQGRLYSATSTCLDWTSADGNRAVEGRPRVGHSWPRSGGPGGGGPGGGGSGANWSSALDESGCAAGVNLIETGPPSATGTTVGDGGGYGGFYCFALVP